MPSAKPSKVPRWAALAAWVASAYYQVGERVTNDSGKLYSCTTAGTTAGSGGPTGTGGSISDGGATWMYIGVNAPAWGSGTSYTKGQRVTNAGNTFQVLQAGAGTSTNAPTGTGARFTLGDGYTWQFLAQATAVTTEPVAGVADTGWLPGAPMSGQIFNYLLRTIEKWIRFISDQFAADGVKRIRYVGTPTLLAGILAPNDGDSAIVGALGLYIFIAASGSSADGIFVITPTDATPGRWVNTAAQLLFVTGSSGASPLKFAAPTGTNTAALVAVGDGTGAGVVGTGGATSGEGGTFTGTASGDGVHGIGGMVSGRGGFFEAGVGSGEPGAKGIGDSGGAGTDGESVTGPGALGVSGSGPGVQGSSTSGPGGKLQGNATRAPLFLVPVATSSKPGTPLEGDIYYDSTLHKLRVYVGGGGWETVTSAP